MKLHLALLIAATDTKKSPYDRHPLSYHLRQFKLKNAWIQQMGTSEWDFFTPEQNACGELKDPENAKLACKLRHGTAFCRVKCATGFMPKNTKEKSQWCRDGRWMPRKTPTCARG